jgi:hypothetical protein
LPQPAPSFHIVGHVGERDDGLGSGDIESADEQAYALLLLGENMLDMGADFRFPSVGSLHGLGHRPAWRFPLMGAARPAVLVEMRLHRHRQSDDENRHGQFCL